MENKEKLKVLDLAEALQKSRFFSFSCFTCKVMVRAADCVGCTLFNNGEDHTAVVNLG